MKAKFVNLGKTYKDFPNLKLSFYTRSTAMEIFFGDPKEEE
jgi:hypothetical protein